MGLLSSNLSSENIEAISSLLSSEGVTFQVKENKIYVSQDRRLELLALCAQNGLPKPDDMLLDISDIVSMFVLRHRPAMIDLP